MQDRAWLIYLDVTKYNVFGYFKQQLNESNDIIFSFGIENKLIPDAEPGQEVYFFLTNTNAKTQKKDYTKKFHFLKRFLCQGEIVEITEEKPNDREFWTYEKDAEEDMQFEKYAKIKITNDLLATDIPTGIIDGKKIGIVRRMALLSGADTKELRDAVNK